jgi:hypothetical protein
MAMLDESRKNGRRKFCFNGHHQVEEVKESDDGGDGTYIYTVNPLWKIEVCKMEAE